MDPFSLFLLTLLGIFVGILVGGVGIGGVLLVPILIYVLEIDIHLAIAAAMLSYAFSGIVGTWVYASKGSIKWNMAYYLLLAASPGAFLGAFISFIIPGDWLEIFIAFLIIFAGINSLLKPKTISDKDRSLSVKTLLFVGFITGVGSALSGTGGPLILVPILVWLNISARVAVGLSQAIQIPIALLATIGNFLHATVSFTLSAVIAVSLMVGVFAGARISHALSQPLLEKIVAWLLVSVGFFIISRSLFYN